MAHQTKKLNCSITVFCAISLLLIISLLFSLTEICRMKVNKLYMQVAANSSTDSLFSLYHRELWNKYHIFGLENFDDEILKSEYMDFLEPHIKDNDNYINNYYISMIDNDDIDFTKENLIDKNYFEEEILSYMKYGIIDAVINFGGEEFDINTDVDLNELQNEIEEATKKYNDSKMYQKMYEKYFNFKKDIVKLEKYAKNAMNGVADYNNYIRNAHFSTGANITTIYNNYEKITGIENRLSDVKNNLVKYCDDMDKFRLVVEESKQKYENDKMNYEIDSEIDNFVMTEFSHFLDYVDVNSDTNSAIRNELENVNNIYPLINQYKNKCNSLEEEINSLEEEKDEISRDKDMDSEEKKEARQEINEELKELYEAVKELGEELSDDKESFIINDLILPMSRNCNFDITAMFDKVMQFMEDGFLSLCLEQNEIDELNKNNLLYDDKNIESDCDIVNKILLSEYELNFFNYYNKENNGKNTLSNSTNLEVEKLINGKNNDKDNITGVISRILAIREGCNMFYLFSNPEKINEVQMYVAGLFGGFSPIVVETMLIVAISAWAMCQSFVDVYNIMHDGRVPFIHNDSTFTFSLESIVNMSLTTLKNNSEESDKGLGYEDYLRILLLSMEQNIVNSRMVSIMEYDMKREQENFSMDNLIFGMNVSHTFHCKHWFTNMVLYRPDNVTLDDEYKMEINTYYDYIE